MERPAVNPDSILTLLRLSPIWRTVSRLSIAALSICIDVPLARSQSQPGTIEASTNASAATGPNGLSQLPSSTEGTTPIQLGSVTVTADLDAAREEIAPSLGAVTFTIGSDQIQTMGQG
ncbi:MAG: hypothetical protein ABSF76_05435, partial [Opitutaceae bacterium]